MTIQSLSIKNIEESHMKCDGTFNVVIYFKDETDLCLYGLSLRTLDTLKVLCKKYREFSIDERYLTRSNELWASQNGIAA